MRSVRTGSALGLWLLLFSACSASGTIQFQGDMNTSETGRDAAETAQDAGPSEPNEPNEPPVTPPPEPDAGRPPQPDAAPPTDAGPEPTPDAGPEPVRDAGPQIPQGQGYPLDIAQIHSGHSLTDTAMFQGSWPGHGRVLINALQPNAANVGKSTVPGSPMQLRRETPVGYGAPDAYTQIADWELLVITENNLTQPEALFPSGWQREFRESRRQELRIWLDHAWTQGNNGAGTPLIYYTNWPAHEDYPPSASWRQRLEDNEVEWLARIVHAENNSTSDAPPIRVIPGNVLMMRLYDDADAGRIPGLADAQAFLNDRSGWWVDNVHPGPYLSLALAYMHIAVIHQEDLGPLPHTGLGMDPEPSAALASYLKTVVEDVVASYPRAHVGPAAP